MSAHRWSVRCSPPRGLVAPVPVDPQGLTGPTPGAARGPRWRVTSHGLYVPANTPTGVPEQRIIEQSARLPPGGAATGWAACRLHGANFLDGLGADGLAEVPVPLAIGPTGNIRDDARVTISRERLTPDEVTRVVGIPVTRAERAVFDAVRLARTDRDAVAVLDTCVAAGITSIERVSTYVDRHPGWKRIARARFACLHARERAKSLAETALRLIAELDAGLPRLHVNCPVHDRSGRLLGLADLLDEEAGLVIEFDGADHRSRRQHTRDTRRDEDMRGVELEVTRVTGTDLRDTGLVVGRLQRARSRARFLPPGQRRWEARPVPDCAEAELRRAEVLAEVNAEMRAAQPWTQRPG